MEKKVRRHIYQFSSVFLMRVYSYYYLVKAGQRGHDKYLQYSIVKSNIKPMFAVMCKNVLKYSMISLIIIRKLREGSPGFAENQALLSGHVGHLGAHFIRYIREICLLTSVVPSAGKRNHDLV